MADLKLGTKHVCSSCETKFYDFGKPQLVCPKCGTDQKTPEASDEPEESPAPVPVDDVPKPAVSEPEEDLDDGDDDSDFDDEDDDEGFDDEDDDKEEGDEEEGDEIDEIDEDDDD